MLAIPHLNILKFPLGGAQQALRRKERYQRAPERAMLMPQIAAGGIYGGTNAGAAGVKEAAEEAATNWWDGALAAYQAIGAASYAASKVNLANPGTYDATDGVAASWDATDGWTFGGSHYLDSNVVPTLDGTWSMAIRLVKSAGGTFPTPIGQRENTTSYPDFVITYDGSSTTFRNAHVTGYTHGSVLTSGVLIVAGNKAYSNGSEIGTLTVGSATGTRSIYIGAQNEQGVAQYFFVGTVQAVAIYNSTLSGAQAAALSTAMAALS